LENLLEYFAGLAIFISCLGLFGLSAYIAERRTKEIGIRKVLGASIPQVCGYCFQKILIVLVNDKLRDRLTIALYFFTKLVNEIRIPDQYRSCSFHSAALMALIITMATISFQAIRAAIANPSKSFENGVVRTGI